MPPKRPGQAGPGSKPKRTRKAYKEPPKSSRKERNDCIHVITVQNAKPKISSFLSLPRELRDQIYHEVWKSMRPFEVTLPAKGDHKSLAEASGLHIDHYIFRVFYGTMCCEPPLPEPKPLPKKRRKTNKAALMPVAKPKSPWFLTSKQILYEAMEQFNSQVTWTHTGQLKNERLQPAAWKAPLIKRRSTRLGPILLGLRNAANITMEVRFCMYVHGKMDAKEAPISVVDFEGTCAEQLRTIAAGIAGTPSVKRLSLAIQADAWRGGANNHPILVDLRRLQALDLPNLQYLQLDMTFNAEFHSDRALMIVMRMKLGRLSKKIFGGDVREQFFERNAAAGRVEWLFIWTRR